jgi:hypothetical protein
MMKPLTGSAQLEAPLAELRRKLLADRRHCNLD